MKVVVEVSKEDLKEWQAESLDEVRDWFQQMLRHPVDAWNGDMLFFDDTKLEIKEV